MLSPCTPPSFLLSQSHCQSLCNYSFSLNFILIIISSIVFCLTVSILSRRNIDLTSHTFLAPSIVYFQKNMVLPIFISTFMAFIPPQFSLLGFYFHQSGPPAYLFWRPLIRDEMFYLAISSLFHFVPLHWASAIFPPQFNW